MDDVCDHALAAQFSLHRYYHPDLAKQHLGLIRRAHRLNVERDRDNARVYGLASALAHTLNREECIDLLLVSDCRACAVLRCAARSFLLPTATPSPMQSAGCVLAWSTAPLRR
jgi:hypothetical protein